MRVSRIESLLPALIARVPRSTGCVLAAIALLLTASPSAGQDTRDRALGSGVVDGETLSDPAPGAGDTEAPEDDGLPNVALAAFTTEISSREPVDDVSFLGSDSRVIYFFMDVRNMKGETLEHVWTYRGEEMGTVRFDVKGDRWRAWSSKQLLPAWLGEWTVSVINSEGEVLATESFTYQEAD